MDLRNFVDVNSRRKALEAHLNIDLSNMGTYSLDTEQASTKNCENMIGIVQVPLGIAGPIAIRNPQSAIRNYYIPLATTEGALVASVSRGCKAVTESGGVTVFSKKIGITRAPVFRVQNISEGNNVINWLEKNFSQIAEIAKSSSEHLTLLAIKPWLLGRSLYVRFSFDTQDAMGMNMATIAASVIAEFIEKETKIHCVAVSGNMCVDKKPNYLNFIEGRGYNILAECLISEKIITSVLKTEKAKILEVAERKLHQASILSGTIGSNAHIANVLSAMFLATGQDIAHVSECSMGVTTVEDDKEGLYISVYLPDLVVGTVGGGTSLATQKEALRIMGLDAQKEKGTGQKLAEIIGAAVLAGEISLLASLAENSLTKAHKKLGRGIK
ncbi:hydroxymethylglutaryl-CoA reductase [Patescibacteria group bacterium]|nr:hydroxymethylglutaryl-CoA reductase [Patescibacteria group bacterium]